MAILAQLSGCFHLLFIWNPVNQSGQHQAMNWALPLSLIFISFGWWENYVDKDAPNCKFRVRYCFNIFEKS